MSTARAVADAVARGQGIAARIMGGWCVLYRPDLALQPLRPTRALMRLPVRFVAAGRRAGSLPHPVHEALLDSAYVRMGDVLVDAEAAVTWIVASCETFLPVLCVRAQRTVSVTRGGEVGGYGGAGPSVTLLTGWPASMVGAGGGIDQAGIAGDVAPGSWSVLLPLLPNDGLPRAGDVLRDDLGRRGVVTVADPTANGWHLMVRQAVP